MIDPVKLMDDILKKMNPPGTNPTMSQSVIAYQKTVEYLKAKIKECYESGVKEGRAQIKNENIQKQQLQN